jgi:hypothetical protein
MRREFSLVLMLLLARFSFSQSVFAPAIVQDIFGRTLNDRRITLIDREGYVANPLITIFLSPPANWRLPATAILTADNPRLYFNTPSEVSSNGPSKTVNFFSAEPVPVKLSIFPDRDSLDEEHTLYIEFLSGSVQVNSVPIHVLDQDLPSANEFPVVVNFDRDTTGFFTNETRRALVEQAADDWSGFFADMQLDPVPVGAETTTIWSNNFNGSYYFTNTNSYTGYQLYAYGTTNTAHRSGGETSYSGSVQRSHGTPLKTKRSGGFEAEIYGNYNTFGWFLITNDDHWLDTGNLGHETNDFYSIAHHEIGHALIFNPAHPGFQSAKSAGAFSSPAVTNYYGAPVPIDQFDHLNGVVDPESGQGAFGYEYYGEIPRKRWLLTKLDLLCAQEVGYTLRNSTLFAPLALNPQNPRPANLQKPYSYTFSATGGIPIYNFDLIDGSLPPGLILDSFTGTIGGIPTATGSFPFNLRLRDYHPNSAALTNIYTLTVSSLGPISLELLSVQPAGPGQLITLSLTGAVGDRAILQASPDLLIWTPISTNIVPSSDLSETTPLHHTRYYRALQLP